MTEKSKKELEAKKKILEDEIKELMAQNYGLIEVASPYRLKVQEIDAQIGKNQNVIEAKRAELKSLE